MVSNNRRLDLHFNKEFREKLLQNFQTDDLKEIQKIIYKFLENPNSQSKELDVDLEYKKFRNENLKKRNLQLDIKNRLLLVHDLKYSPSDAVEISSGRKELDEEDKLRCPECNWCADSTRTKQNQVDSMIYHLKDSHKRSPTPDEQALLLEIVSQ